MSILRDYARVSKRAKCPICFHEDWCLISKDGTSAVCARVESSRRMGDAGWLHVLSDPIPKRSSLAPTPLPVVRDLGSLASECMRKAGICMVMDLASQLKVMTTSLYRLGVGWDGSAYTFPMQDETGRVVGIRRRMPDGSKLSVKGGHEGCFVPQGVIGDQTDVVLLCEGPTDTAAALDAGFPAIGRPSCTGGTKIVVALLKGREAVIVSDDDGPGRAGAERLADALIDHRIACRIVLPRSGKDLRAWHPTQTQISVVTGCAKYWTKHGSQE